MATKSSAPAGTATSTAIPSTMPRTRTGAGLDPAAIKTYVMDTSVLLSDPSAMIRFAEDEVVLPVVVVTQLEGKRDHPELGDFAGRRRACSTTCEPARPARPSGGGRRRGREPARRAEQHRPVGPAGWLPARRKRKPHLLGRQEPRQPGLRRDDRQQGAADAGQGVGRGLQAEEYRHEQGVGSGWTGIQELDLAPTSSTCSTSVAASSMTAGRAALPHRRPALAAGKRSGAGGCRKQIRLVRGDRDAFGLHAGSAE